MADKNKIFLGTNQDTYIAADDAGNIILQNERGGRAVIDNEGIKYGLGDAAPAAIGGGGIEQLITDAPQAYSIAESGYYTINTNIGGEKIYNYLIDNNMSSSIFNIKLELHDVADVISTPELWFTNSTFKFAGAGSFSVAVRTIGPDTEFRIDGNISATGIGLWNGAIGNLNNFTPKERTLEFIPSSGLMNGVLYLNNIPTRTINGYEEADWVPIEWILNPADNLDNVNIGLLSMANNTPPLLIVPRIIITPLV